MMGRAPGAGSFGDFRKPAERTPMVRPIFSLLAIPFLLFMTAVAAADNPTAALPRRPPVRPWQVERLIQMHVDAIYGARNKSGHWDARESDPGGEDREFAGTTALAVYALLAAGESPENPKLKPALNWLKTANTNATYVIGIRLNAYNYLPHQAIKELAKADQNFLFKAQIPAIDPKTKMPNASAGLYDYMGTPD